MTDAEVICTFMEPKPTKSIFEIVRDGEPSPGKWWLDKHPSSAHWYPCGLTLDRLHEVEDRLTEDQRRHYCCLMWQHTDAPTANPIEDLISRHRFTLLHASAEQKVKALASVLRTGEVR